MIPSYTKVGSNQLIQLTSVQQVEELRQNNKDKMIIVLFWAHWYRECEMMRKLFVDLCMDHNFIKFCWADVDKDKEVTNFFRVDAVPFVILLHVRHYLAYQSVQPNKKDGEKLHDPKRSTVTEVLTSYETYYGHQFFKERVKAFKEIEEILASYPIIVFLRGSLSCPECKASEVLVDYFQKMEVKFRHVDVLDNPKIKEWLKHQTPLQKQLKQIIIQRLFRFKISAVFFLMVVVRFLKIN